MDQDRYIIEKKKYPKTFVMPTKEDKTTNYRLINYEEVPYWLKEEVKIKKQIIYFYNFFLD